MKNIIFFVILFTSNLCLAAVRIDLHLTTPDVKQGALVKAELKLSSDSVQAFPLQKIKNTTFAKFIYFQSVSPVIKAQDTNEYTADARIIFVKIPDVNILKESIAGIDVEIHLGNLSVIPTEASEQLIFGTFTVPTRLKLFNWFLSLAAIILISAVGWKINKKFQQRNAIKKNKKNIISTLRNIHTYDEVVQCWKKKSEYLKVFPHLEVPFKNLEQVLFKYQFKAHQSSVEKELVVDAYRTFLSESEGGFSGI